MRQVRPMSVVRIGYMGIPGSNSEAAAMEFAEEQGWEDPILIPLTDSARTVGAMLTGECDYGVVAVSNIEAGPVIETMDALQGHDDIVTIGDKWLPIHHCVFVKGEPGEITVVSSHIQALQQCRRSLESLFPDADLMESEDTALSAQHLAEGKLPDTAAVLCRRNAGEMFGLRMIHENIEDNKENMTEFHLLARDRDAQRVRRLPFHGGPPGGGREGGPEA